MKSEKRVPREVGRKQREKVMTETKYIEYILHTNSKSSLHRFLL